MKKYYSLIFILLFFNVKMFCQKVYDQNVESGNSGGGKGEAHMAINPTDSNKMVIGFMHLTQGLTFKIYHSSNGGDSWQASTLNPISQIALDYPNYSAIGGGDIIFAYDKKGDLYCSWIYLLANLNYSDGLDSCIWTSYWAKSSDNGHTFTFAPGSKHFFARGKVNPEAEVIHDYEDGIADRQWMAVDLTDGLYANRLYVGYINFAHIIEESGLKVKKKDILDDQFSPAKVAFAGMGQLTNIQIDHQGVLHYTFCDVEEDKIYHVSSADGGNTFTSPHLIFQAEKVMAVSPPYLLNDRENAAPSLAIDGANNLFLTWNDIPAGSSVPKGYYAYSKDGGVTWSQPLDLLDLFGFPIFMPVVAAKNNKVSIAGYQIGNDRKAIYNLVCSQDNGIHFSTSIKLSSDTTDFFKIGKSAFIGDYSSSVRTNCIIYNTWSDYRSGTSKQYISKYNECASVGIFEITPIETSYSFVTAYREELGELQIQIQSEQDDELSFKLLALDGKEVMNHKARVNVGETTTTLDLRNVTNGQYILQCQNKRQSITTRLIQKF